MNNIIFKTLLLKGEAGNNILSITKTGTSGTVDTYTITLTDGSTTTFEVTNGSDIESITKTATAGLVDTYTVTLTDGSTSTFEVTNGADGADGDDGRGIVSIVKTSTTGLVDTYTITYTDNTTSTFTVTNGTGAEVNKTYNIPVTAWVANTDATTSTDYPYITSIGTDLYTDSDKPVWQMGGVGTIPTSTERESIDMVLEAVFKDGGITLYATDQPTVALTLEVKGGSGEDNERVYLYNEGNECLNITGGWTIDGFYTNTQYTRIAGTKNADNIEVETDGTHATRCFLGINNLIDFTGYSKISYEYERLDNDDGYPAISLLTDKATGEGSNIPLYKGQGKQTGSFYISSGSRNIAIIAENVILTSLPSYSHHVKLYKLWLE